MSELVLSLFPGLGLLDLAFEEQGWCIVRGPDVIWGGDIRRFHPSTGHFAGVIGGPPCQAFSSLVHLVRANGLEPRFGNLIPEFERCIQESAPAWFLMENVPAAPEPVVARYGVTSFLLDNSALAGEGGFGQEQRRVRRFSFGQRGVEKPPNLLRWIDLAVFLLPDAAETLTQWTPDNSLSAKRRSAVVGTLAEVPVAIGGSGKPKLRRAAVTKDSASLSKMHEIPDRVARPNRVRQPAVTSTDAGERPSEKRARVKAVSGSNGGNGSQRNTPGAGNAGKGRYRLGDALRLQGLPEDFLDHCPFTAEGKLKAIANGVPRWMGVAVAKAVRQALGG